MSVVIDWFSHLFPTLDETDLDEREEEDDEEDDEEDEEEL